LNNTGFHNRNRLLRAAPLPESLSCENSKENEGTGGFVKTLTPLFSG
jgi:hypothetical protein